MKDLAFEDFIKIGEALFGEDRWNWRFVCPCCGFVQTAHDYKAAGAPEGAVGFSCVGRWSGAKHGCFEQGEGPCDYAGGGLFRMNKITVDLRPMFLLEGMEVPA